MTLLCSFCFLPHFVSFRIPSHARLGFSQIGRPSTAATCCGITRWRANFLVMARYCATNLSNGRYDLDVFLRADQ
jgi:hypothetical protein